jgi:hypothetical protein
MERNEWDDVDRGLDDAIRSYSNAEPPPGLENRILQRVITRQSRPFFAVAPVRFYAAGVACLCLLIVLATVMTHRRQSRVVPATPKPHSNVQDARKAPANMPLTASSDEARPRSADRPRTAAHTRRPRRVESNTIAEKRDTFPSPAPLTAEERVICNLNANEYAKVVREFVEFSNRNSEPLHIADIVIKPLDESEPR